jgi:hypothetical protein
VSTPITLLVRNRHQFDGGAKGQGGVRERSRQFLELRGQLLAPLELLGNVESNERQPNDLPEESSVATAAGELECFVAQTEANLPVRCPRELCGQVCQEQSAGVGTICRDATQSRREHVAPVRIHRKLLVAQTSPSSERNPGQAGEITPSPSNRSRRPETLAGTWDSGATFGFTQRHEEVETSMVVPYTGSFEQLERRSIPRR